MTRRAAVIGHPVAHSLSPVLHRAAYTALGLAWQYDAIDVSESEAAAFVAGRGPEWVGLSVTAPLKGAVRAALAAESALATRTGAVNTVVFAGDSERRIVGHNTDVAGIVSALAEAGVGPGQSTGIVGAGGTAAAALAAAEQLGAPEVLVTARRADGVKDLLSRVPVTGARAVDWDRRATVLTAPVVIVTLPGDAAAGLAQAVPDGPGVLLDVTYAPWPTTLAAAWAARGGAVVGGHRMLLWQAAEQVRLMTGRTAPVAQMSAALAAALRTRGAGG